MSFPGHSLSAGLHFPTGRMSCFIKSQQVKVPGFHLWLWSLGTSAIHFLILALPTLTTSPSSPPQVGTCRWHPAPIHTRGGGVGCVCLVIPPLTPAPRRELRIPDNYPWAPSRLRHGSVPASYRGVRESRERCFACLPRTAAFF